MTQVESTVARSRWLRVAVVALLVAALVGGVYLVWPSAPGTRSSAYFTSAVGLYPGDDVRVVGVPVGTIDSIEPRADRRQDHHVGRRRRQAARRRAGHHHRAEPGVGPVHSAHPGLHRRPGAGRRRRDRPRPHRRSGRVGRGQGAADPAVRAARPAGRVDCRDRWPRSSTRPPTPSTATATRSATRCASCRRPRAGSATRAPTCSARSAICRCWSTRCPTATSRSCSSPTTWPRCRRCWPTAPTDLDDTLGTLNQALADVKGFLNENNEALIGQVDKLADFTKILTDHSDDIEQVLHITPNGLANFYNIYNPAQGTVGGLLSLPNFANPVQFICGGTFDVGAYAGQLQARRDLPRSGWARCSSGSR